MPNISLTIPETSQSITRPVIFDIISQIQDITKINKDSKIFYPGDSQKMSVSGSTIDSKNDRSAIFNTDRYSFIDVEEDYDHDTLGSTAVTRREHIPVFIDPALKTVVAPIYATSNVIINFKYRCPSKTEALRWRDDIRMRVSQLRDINLHNITYHYLLPSEILLVIKTIYDRREEFLGYGQTIEEYVTSHATDRLTLIGDLVGKDARLGISETQMRIVGIYGFDGIPEKPERDDGTGTWTVSFSYKFNYEKPIACNMRYPITVHNQLMPKDYIAFANKSQRLDKIDKSFTNSLHALNSFESDTTMGNRRNADALIRIPDFDDYAIPTVPRGTGTVMIALSEVNTDDKRSLLNLDELGEFIMDADIMQFIREVEWPYMCKMYDSIICLSLYRNDYLTTTGAIVANQALDIKATSDLDLRNQYRIRFGLVVDLTLLSREALDRLRRYPKALVKIIAAMNELLRNRPDFVNLGDKNYISLIEFSPIYAMMTGRSYDAGRGNPWGEYYGAGRNINNWPGRGYQNGMFGDIDPRLIEWYRKNRVGNNAVQVTGIMSFRKDS